MFKTVVEKFTGLLRKSNQAQDLIDMIIHYYNEPHRAYHNLDHIIGMIETAGNICQQQKTSWHRYSKYFIDAAEDFNLETPQILAVLFHDIVYVPGCPSNEDLSIVMMRTLLTRHCAGQYSDEEIDIASTIILDTKTHVPSINQSKPVLDLDLMGLGSKNSTYVTNSEAIRKEFILATDEQWKEGRIKFLVGMLNKERIFHTTLGFTEFESAARANMNKELLSLGYSHQTVPQQETV